MDLSFTRARHALPFYTLRAVQPALPARRVACSRLLPLGTPDAIRLCLLWCIVTREELLMSLEKKILGLFRTKRLYKTF
jgi:hypothetical protein